MKRTTLFAAALMAAAAVVTGPALADGDAAKGKKVFNRCKACHVADEAKNKIGPTLLGVFGRKAGMIEGFKYSDAMKEADVVWSEETIAEYVKKPKDFIPGNKMAFAGLRKDSQIEDLIAYLKEETAE